MSKFRIVQILLYFLKLKFDNTASPLSHQQHSFCSSHRQILVHAVSKSHPLTTTSSRLHHVDHRCYASAYMSRLWSLFFHQVSSLAGNMFIDCRREFLKVDNFSFVFCLISSFIFNLLQRVLTSKNHRFLTPTCSGTICHWNTSRNLDWGSENNQRNTTTTKARPTTLHIRLPLSTHFGWPSSNPQRDGDWQATHGRNRKTNDWNHFTKHSLSAASFLWFSLHFPTQYTHKLAVGIGRV